MTAFIILGSVAFGVSFLTLFSGFGLGTLLMPAFALFFPVQVAVGSTALVHGANNLFKTALLARHARKDVVLKFGLPAIGAAMLGAALLTILSRQEALATWAFMGREARITPIKLVMGLLIFSFALMELLPRLRRLRAPARWLPLGGLLSGFFGGLSGHQGALRAAFLSPLGLTPVQFAATQTLIGLCVDVSRLSIYAFAFSAVRSADGPEAPLPWSSIGVATLCAFAGAFLGKRLITKVTIGSVQMITGALLLMVGTALLLGIV